MSPLPFPHRRSHKDILAEKTGRTARFLQLTLFFMMVPLYRQLRRRGLSRSNENVSVEFQALSTGSDTEEKIASEDPQIPPQLSIVFVGDSLSRYMYLSLVYFLKRGHWATAGYQLLEKVKDPNPSAWNEWLVYSQQQLETEQCDCCRYWTSPFKWYNHCKNRYFFNQSYHIAFITKFGGNPFHGHLDPSEIFSSYIRNQSNKVTL